MGKSLCKLSLAASYYGLYFPSSGSRNHLMAFNFMVARYAAFLYLLLSFVLGLIRLLGKSFGLLGIASKIFWAG